MNERRRDYPKILERLGELEQLTGRMEERQIAIDKRINGSIDDIKDHINAGSRWRSAIIGISVAVIIQIIAFAYYYGNLSKTVNVNERILLRLVNDEEHRS